MIALESQFWGFGEIRQIKGRNLGTVNQPGVGYSFSIQQHPALGNLDRAIFFFFNKRIFWGREKGGRTAFDLSEGVNPF